MIGDLPSTSYPVTQVSERRLKLASRHASPLRDELNNEMDEWAPIRLTILLSALLFGLLIYFFVKMWKGRIKSIRMPVRQTKDTTFGWTDALLEAEDASDNDDLVLTR